MGELEDATQPSEAKDLVTLRAGLRGPEQPQVSSPLAEVCGRRRRKPGRRWRCGHHPADRKARGTLLDLPSLRVQLGGLGHPRR
eukprot:14912039-Alexandrium_andersonii.AAC.1